MVKKRGSTHLSNDQISLIVEWILSQHETPSLQDVCRTLLRRFGIERQPDTIRKRPEIKHALETHRSRERIDGVRTKLRPTSRKFEQLKRERDRLLMQVETLQAENSALIERNLSLVNAMKARQVPASSLERPLGIIDRAPTELPSRRTR